MKKTLFSLLVVAAGVAACGGEYATPPATAQVPASASQTIDGFISYLRELIVASADMLEPVDTSSVTPPTDEVSEPQKVD